MAVMAREEWTDQRLDDMNERVTAGFSETRAEMREEFQTVRAEIRDMRTEIGAVNRTIQQFAFAMIGTVFLGFMGTIAALVSLV
jgi:D-mannonate dehydratase